jgi:NADH:ubiquinone oxidoreductase subunit 5 (subunit L)/multisubunit Na+/H+ antiporter MnhA subunit
MISTRRSSPRQHARSAAFLWRIGDEAVIDGLLVNGSARLVGWFSGVVRQVQTGYLYHYAFAMIIGLAVLLLAGSSWRWLISSRIST